MTARDPAIARFAAINFMRISGVVFVIGGILVVTNRVMPSLPDWVGYLLIANGLLDVFVVPLVMARKWRTPR
ncbi:hypothetical protein WSK_2659 [Novosphingobium sp. Rr 2-17]|uniref:hypothetical protein n=1 Tax=Novosphingobium sp. Rr 2-17 TaxID=555793 RepID=UPI00026988AF|nr:hypothetical protein [Novosphingobium sp. Rr 2-17]EIZ78611.1 hypothetical protein WSK_2659 [Novosphingobium sp. Rr 2-17]